MTTDLNGYELLLLRRFQNDPDTFTKWRERLQKSYDNNRNQNIGEIPHNMWYLTVTLDRKKERFLKFIAEEDHQKRSFELRMYKDTLLMRYLHCHKFTELHLDGIFKYGDDNTLPVEIFLCQSIKHLSLKYNYLDKIPPDIGRMCNLELLALTNNKLQNKSLPHTLMFCRRLKTLFLDNNLLDALPGFLLHMTSLETVHRHGNHNYFKSTFMWYHTDVNERILPVFGSNDFPPRQPEKLQFWAARSVLGSKRDFYADPDVAPTLKDYISEVYSSFFICGKCGQANVISRQGYKVITFKNPYLGNTCVPFQHMACSLYCAREIEIPSRKEQITAARRLDREYDHYVTECKRQYEISTTGVLRQRGGTLMGSMRVRNRGARRHTTLVNTIAVDSCEESSGATDAIRSKMTSQRHNKCVIS